MIPIVFQRLFVAALLLVGVGVFGCRERMKPRDATAVAKPSPEESFERIMESFRRRVEGTPIGFVMRSQSGHSMLVGQNKVSHELIPPAGPSDHFRAIITVERQSRYSMQRSAPDASDKDGQQDPNPAVDQAAAVESSVEIFDSELVNKPGTDDQPPKPATDAGGRKTAREEFKVARDYELVYENGRWVLTTKLDLKTEQSIQHAFELALRTQA